MKNLLANLSWDKGLVRQVLVCCSVSILPFIYGLLEIWPSVAIKKILGGEAGFPVTPSEVSVIVSLPTFAETLVPIIFGFVLVKFGRKTNLILNAVVYIITWLLIAFAPSSIFLMVANFAGGVGCAIVLIIGPIYIAEISDKNKRGALISIYITAISIGQIFLSSVGIYISYFQMNLIALVLAVLALFCIIAFATESPYWHLICGNERKAKTSFEYYWSSKADEAEMATALAELKEIVEDEMKSACSYLELFRTRSNVKASVIVIVLSVLQGASGIIAILTYASTTLPKYDGFWQPSPTVALVSVVNLITNIISVGLIDRWGRKPLMIVSSAGSGVGTGIMATYYFIDEYTKMDTTNIKCIPYVGIFVFITFFGLAMATIPHLLAGELYPVNIRYQASLMSVCFYAVFAAFFNYIYFAVCHHWGVSVMFLIFTTCNFSATLFSVFYLFETKNLSLNEIQKKLMGNKMNPRRKQSLLNRLHERAFTPHTPRFNRFSI